jgi:hypothetical protein
MEVASLRYALSKWDGYCYVLTATGFPSEADASSSSSRLRHRSRGSFSRRTSPPKPTWNRRQSSTSMTLSKPQQTSASHLVAGSGIGWTPFFKERSLRCIQARRKSVSRRLSPGNVYTTIPSTLPLCTSSPTYRVLDLLMARLLATSQRPGRPSGRCIGVVGHALGAQPTVLQATGRQSSRSHLV